MNVDKFSFVLIFIFCLQLGSGCQWHDVDGQHHHQWMRECTQDSDSQFQNQLMQDKDFGRTMAAMLEIDQWDLKHVSDEILLLTLWNERRMFSGWKQVYHTLSTKERDLLYRGCKTEARMIASNIQETKFQLLKDLKEKQWPLSAITKSDMTKQKEILTECQSFPDIASLITLREPDTMKMSILATELMSRYKFNFILTDKDATWAIRHLNEKCLSHPEMYRRAAYFGQFAPIRRNADPHMQLFLLIQMKIPERFINLLDTLYQANKLPNAKGMLHLFLESESFPEARNMLKQIMLQ